MKKIKKAIIPVAGFGTRFLPASKSQPKEMLSLVDKPVIQYIVEEAVASGIEQIIFITSSIKRALEDHFDRNFELEYRLAEKKKIKELKEIMAISDMAKFVYIRQKNPLGDGHAILCAKDLIDDDEPVAVLFGDDIVDAKTPCLKQMIDVYNKYQDPVIAALEVPNKDIKNYGCIDGNKIEDRVISVKGMIEKPDPAKAPSNLAIIGKYIITPDIFKALEKIGAGGHADGEIRLIDGFLQVLEKRSIIAYNFEGDRYDCGDKLGFLKANVAFGLKHPDLKSDFRKYLKQNNF